MKRTGVLLPGVLLLIGVFALPSASADHVRDERVAIDRIVRLVTAPETRPAPTLGLAGLRELPWWTGASAFDPGPGEGLDEDGRRIDGANVDAWLSEVLATRSYPSTELRALASDIARTVVVKVDVEGPDGRLDRSTVHVRPGRRAGMARTRARARLVDYDPALACDNSGGLRPSALGDPQVRTLVGGLAVDLHAFVREDPDGKARVSLDALVQRGRFEDPAPRIPTGARFLGELELPRYRGAVLRMAGTVADGGTLTARIDSRAGFLRVRLTPRLDPPPAPYEGAGPRRLEAGLLGAPRVASRTLGEELRHESPFVQPLVFLETEAPPALPSNDLAHVAWRLVTPELPALVDALGGLWIQAPSADVRRVRDAIASLAARRETTLDLDLAIEAGGWVVAAARLPVSTHRPSWARVGVEQALVLDADTEVG